jgi:hypothetical protein
MFQVWQLKPVKKTYTHSRVRHVNCGSPANFYPRLTLNKSDMSIELDF